MFNKCYIITNLNIITGEYYGKETTKREPSKEFEEVSKR
jgi:hypothetical protein